jgi:2-keto-4-pentenoate hydratase/2-oxohepta-3-ene-1,7-dioic acid hydratase in catechol pathway
MRIIRFENAGRVHFGRPLNDRFSSAEVFQGDSPLSLAPTGRTLSVERLLAPIIPTDILCIGLNYKDHASEGAFELPKVPMLFIKSSNTLNHPGGIIRIPRLSQMIDYEAELAVVIGRDAKYVPRNRALEYVFGYTAANDVTARDWQREKNLGGGQFARGKSFDTFCPLGPAIVTADEIADPNRLCLRCHLNGQVMQDQSTSDMVFDVPALIESLSSTLTLRAGSVILTGTPKGVGFARKPPVWLKPGDRIAVEIENIGRLENTIEAEPAE